LDEHNLNLCTLRDLGIEIAKEENVAFADLFWPMYVAQITAAKKYGTDEKPYQVTGNDGIHPPWAGQVIMAYGFLKSMGIREPIANLEVIIICSSNSRPMILLTKSLSKVIAIRFARPEKTTTKTAFVPG